MAPSQMFDPLTNGISGGVSDIFDRSLGPQVRPGAANPYEQRSTNRINMLAAYEQQTPMIRKTIDDLTMTAEFDWMTTYILPFWYTDQIEVAWQQWENTDTYMGPTPHLSNSNVITTKRKIRKANMIRRGLAYEFEDDFIRTADGRASVYAAILCIGRSIRETVNVEGLRSLRSCHIHDIQQAREYNLFTIEDLDAHLDRFTERFMIVQKEKHGIEKLNKMVDTEQERVKGKANAWILTRDVQDYCETVPPEKVDYYLGGQEAVDRINGKQVGPIASAKTMGNLNSIAPRFTIKGTPVFIAKSYYVEGLTQADLLSRIVEIGIYNLMADRTTNYAKYDSAIRNLKIYNNDTDDWHIEKFSNAIRNLPIWDDKGKLIDVFAPQRTTQYSVKNDTSDFLSFPILDATKKRQNIKYIGEMNKSWIHTKHFLNGAQTMLNVLSYNNPVTARDMVQDFDAAASGDVDVNRRVDAHLRRIEQLAGTQNLFTLPVDSDGFRMGTLRTNLVNALYETSRTRGPGIGAGIDDAFESKVQIFLRDALGAPIPDDHPAKPRVAQIVADSTKTWEVRAEKIKNVVLECVNSTPNFHERLNDTPAVDAWYAKRIEGFKTKIVDAMPVAAAVTQDTTSKQTLFKGPISNNMPIFATVQAPGSGNANFPAREAPKTKNNMTDNIDAIYASGAPLLMKVLAAVYAGFEFDRDTLIMLHETNIAVPLNIMLARAHCAYKTRYGIKVATGGLTGFTSFGNSDLSIGHDSGQKKGFMHYTAYFGSVVTDPRHVAVMPDIYCQKYMGGMGVTYWTPQEYKKDPTRRNKSIIAFPLPPVVDSLDKRIDMRGRWYTHQKQGFITPERFNREMFPGAMRMNQLFGIDPIATISLSMNSNVNYWLSQGMQWYYSPESGTWSEYSIEQSPFGDKVYPGCGKVRNGMSVHLIDPGYATNRH